MLINKFLLSTICFFLFSIAACKGGKNEDIAQVQSNAKDRNDSIEKIVAQTEQNYHDMNIHQLLEKLVEQSKRQKEPFNSLAFRELKKRKDVSSDTILSVIHQLKGSDALLPLLLLRKLHEKEYMAIPSDQRAAVLTDALEKSKTFNTWGLPHLYLEDASKAMIECGQSAYDSLKKMLGETRPAPIWGGGQEGMEADKYKYRLCDYALFFIKRITNDSSFIMPVKPEERDALIKGIK